jgi:anaerobic selenocysteine-containing dehydrogenase
MCGLTLEVEGQRIVKVTNDADDPFSQGFCCPKGLAIDELHHDPSRLKRPLVRDGGKLREASWEEALERASDGLAKVIRGHGKHAVGVYLGNPVVHNLGATLGAEVWRKLLRSRNRYTANSQDVNPHLLANYLMFGAQLSHPVPDLDRCRFLLVLGANPLVSNGSMMTAPAVGKRLRAIHSRGGRVVVIDPRRTETAAIADTHHVIRPGRDPLLLLALAREICAEGLWDREWLARHAEGYERLPALLEAFTPERVEPLLGSDLSADAIRALARELATAEGAAVYTRFGVCNTEFAGLTTWAGQLLNIVTGNLDRPGGVMFPEGPASWFFRQKDVRGSYDRYRSPQGCPEVNGEYPCHILADQIETQAIRGFVTFSGNPALSVPNGRRLRAALSSLDCLVSFDIYLSETAQLADVVLPPRSSLHDPHFDMVFAHLAVADTARWSPPVFGPTDQPSEWELITQLASRVHKKSGLGGTRKRAIGWLMKRLGVERVAGALIRFGPMGAGANPLSGKLTRERLARHPHGLPIRPLTPRLADRVVHANGKIRLTPEPYVQDLPRLAALLDRAPESDLVLIGRRHLRSNNSWFHNLPVAHKKGNRCQLLVHPETAAAHGLATGDRARVTSRIGSVEVEVELTKGISPSCVSLPHGWGHATHGGDVARAHPGVSANDLTDDALFDPLTGNSALHGVKVELHALS